MGQVREDVLAMIKLLRVKGFSFLEIRVHPVLVNAVAKEDLQTTVDYYEEQGEDPVELDLMRLDSAIKVIMEKLAGGNYRVIWHLVNVLQRRSGLLGMDAPTKLQQTVDAKIESITQQDKAIEEMLRNAELAEKEARKELTQ